MTGDPATAEAPASVGVLCLQTSFEKIPGHIRNPGTFDFPVAYRVVEGATPARVVNEADPALLTPFVDAARDLEAAGVAAITGACGFLILFQRELAASVGVPLYTSSLVQLPMVAAMLGGRAPVGLLAADESALTARHLAAAGAADVAVKVAGMRTSAEFREVMMEGRRDRLDVDRLEADVLAQADTLDGVGAVVIECTDLVPFASAVQRRLGVPVFDIVTLTNMVHATLTRRPYPR
ncbi:MAG TPA: aspartate/glutamate racemase family protein [Rugosimonospora sp.]|nr:aspartate/glutamate racemase family protein [Rugosimonospora sp.]